MSDENDLMEEMIMLCEIRGELDEVANARTEQRIESIMSKLKSMGSQYVS